MSVYTDGKEILKDIINLSKGISDIELKNKILVLQTTFYELNDENRELRLENEVLKNQKRDASRVEWRESAYYPLDNSDNIYCPRCFDKDKNLINMIKSIHINSTHYNAKCPECKTNIETDIPHGMDTSFSF